MIKILDASALMAYLEKEPGYEKIKDLFIEATANGGSLLMSTVNWGEVFYILIRNYGFNEAQSIQHIIETFPVELIPVDVALAKQAAVYKATKKLPYADCFAAALAKPHNGELVTGDMEFKLVEDEIRIIFIEFD